MQFSKWSFLIDYSYYISTHAVIKSKNICQKVIHNNFQMDVATISGARLWSGGARSQQTNDEP